MATASGLTSRPNGRVLAAWLWAACAWAGVACAADVAPPLDPQELVRAVERLRSDAYATRAAATTQLGRAGVGALPALVELLQTDDAAGGRARGIARELIRELGADGRQALLAWLGSGDLPHWPGIIAALHAGGTDGISDYLLAAATVPGTPPAIRDRAIAALGQAPSPALAATLIGQRLDATLTPAALPEVDCLLPPGIATDASTRSEPTVDRFVWNPQTGLPERRPVSPRAARAQEAVHLARDLAAIGPTEPQAVRLVILARLESMFAFADDPASALHDLDADQLLAACTGPDGVDIEALADVLDMAVGRGMFEPAAAAARALEYAALPIGADATTARAPLPPFARRALARALDVPDASLQFNAARTLALAGGDPPYLGSSRVIEVLRHAATSIGGDRVVIAHPDMAIVNSLATGVSRFGYQTVRVATGRAAIVAAREQRDTVLVILSARLNRPSAFETAQFIQQQPYGDIPPILIVVDPLDDDPRGCFLTNLIMKFSGVECVAIVDRLDSFFQPTVDAQSGAVTAPARFPDALAQLAGPRSVDGAARARRAAIRLDQSRQAAVLLGILSRRCWDIPEATLAGLEVAAARPAGAGYNRPAFTPHPSAPADAAIPEPTR